jgi:hypothetical protein
MHLLGVVEIAEPVLGAFQQALVADRALGGFVLAEFRFLGKIRILLGEARAHALDLGRADAGKEVGDVRRGLVRHRAPAADDAFAQGQGVLGRGLAGGEGFRPWRSNSA